MAFVRQVPSEEIPSIFANWLGATDTPFDDIAQSLGLVVEEYEHYGMGPTSSACVEIEDGDLVLLLWHHFTPPGGWPTQILMSDEAIARYPKEKAIEMLESLGIKQSSFLHHSEFDKHQ